jgi:pyruvate dehydrogenase E2 component (dihydrolipoamide acetyltransferase)
MDDVTMPKLSDSMEVGKVIEWKVKEGDAVHEGDILAEIESDKAAMGLECFHDGVLAQIVQGDGAEVAVGAVIARIAAAGEAAAEPREAEAPAKPQPKKPTPPTKEREGEAPAEPPRERDEGRREEVERESVERGVSEEQATEAPPAAPSTLHAPPSTASAPSRQPSEDAERPTVRPHAERRDEQRGGRLAASPLARKLAQEHGIDLATLQGSGPGGRIVAADVEAAAKAGTSRPSAVDAERPTSRPHAERRDEQKEAPGLAPPTIKPSADEELPPLEVTPDEADVEEASFRLRTQARRVTASKHVIPHFYITRGVEVTALLDRKDEVKAKFGASVTHLIMLAVLKTLAQHPEANRSYDRGKIIKWKNVNLGLAVDTESGLTVAVLGKAQGLSLKELVERTGPLVERARSGKLAAEERQHASFTISNLGMFDVEHFEPIVNPPSAITLGVASALPTPVVREGGLAVGKVMRLTLSCDHRIVDGVTAARFLKDLKALLEAPETFL